MMMCSVGMVVGGTSFTSQISYTGAFGRRAVVFQGSGRLIPTTMAGSSYYRHGRMPQTSRVVRIRDYRSLCVWYGAVFLLFDCPQIQFWLLSPPPHFARHQVVLSMTSNIIKTLAPPTVTQFVCLG
jgi:hypothetical protein